MTLMRKDKTGAKEASCSCPNKKSRLSSASRKDICEVLVDSSSIIDSECERIIQSEVLNDVDNHRSISECKCEVEEIIKCLHCQIIRMKIKHVVRKDHCSVL